MAKQSRPKTGGKAGAIVAAGILAAAAGAYFLYGSKDAAKNRKKVKSWALKAKGEVLEYLETAKVDSQEKYNAVVDKVMKKYSQIKSIDPKEVEVLTRDLKRHWKSLQSDLVKVPKVGKKIAKKAMKS